MLQQHPGALEVAQRGGQVQGSASSGVQLLDVGLPGRNEALRSLGGPDLTPQCSRTDVQLPDTESSQHLTVFGRASPPLTSPKRGTSKASPCCHCQTHGEHVRAHWWLPAPSTPGHSQAGLHPPGGHRAGARHSSGGQRYPWHSAGALHIPMHLQAPEKPPPLGFGGGGVVPSCQAAAAGSPPPPGPGAAAGARVPLPEPGAAAAGAERLLRGSPGPWGAVAGAAVVCAKPGAWHPASPEESLVRWRVGTPEPRSPMKEAASHPCPVGDMAGGRGGTLCALSTQLG